MLRSSISFREHRSINGKQDLDCLQYFYPELYTPACFALSISDLEFKCFRPIFLIRLQPIRRSHADPNSHTGTGSKAGPKTFTMRSVSADPDMPPSTPSPTASATPAGGSASRRPPRKSTLTQQQKNQKRQRATQDQLVTLEVEFNKNPTPTAAVRERIAQDINMTERSVQIWFQNRSVSCYTYALDQRND